MATYKKCNLCHDYHYDNLKCKPIFLISHEEYLGDQEKEVRGSDHEEAAERYADYYNSNGGEYPMMHGESEITIQVRALHEQTKKVFIVSAEPSIKYYAKEQ
jgi:hypothetical protein